MTISYKFCYWTKSNNRDSLKCMENLLKLGADPNAVAFSGFGRNPIHLAKNSDKINLLLDNGANINLQNAFGDTALLINTRKHLICYSRHNVKNYLINVQTLLNRGANIYIRNRDGMNFGKLIADSRSLTGKKAIIEVVNKHKINIEQLAKRAVDEASQLQTLEQQNTLRTVNESVRKLSAEQYARNRFEQESECVGVKFSENAFLEQSSCSVANSLTIKNEIEDFQPETMNFDLSNFNNYLMDFEIGAGDGCQMDFEVEQGYTLPALSDTTLKTIKLKDISLQICKKEPTRKFINKSVKEYDEQQQARLRELEQLKKENKKLEQLQVVRERGVRTKAGDRQQLEQAKESNQQEREKRRLENILKLEAETAKVAKQMLAQQAKEKQAREKRQQEKEKQEKEKRSKEKRQKEMSSFN